MEYSFHSEGDRSHFEIYDMYTGAQDVLREELNRVLVEFGAPQLKSPLYNITRELVINALKAVYKKIFFETVIRDLGIGEVDYTEWLLLFRTEIETHNAENLAFQAFQEKQPVVVNYLYPDENLVIEINNPGEPTDIEKKRIQNSIDKARVLENFSYLLDDDEDYDSEAQKEGAGIGLPLIIMTLKGLGIGPEAFSVSYENQETVARVSVNLAKFMINPAVPAKLISNKNEIAGELYKVYRVMDYEILRFNTAGVLLGVTQGFLDKTNLNLKQPDSIAEVLPRTFFEDLFQGSDSILEKKVFHNRKVTLTGANQESLSFLVTGFLDKRKVVISLWQPV